MVTPRKTAAKKAPAKKAAPARTPAKKASATPVKKAAAPAAESKSKKVPLESSDPEFWEPVRPTKKLLAEAPFAVVMMAWDMTSEGKSKGDAGRPDDRDFLGFDHQKDAEEWFDNQTEWCQKDVDTHGDIYHALVLVADNGETLSKIEPFSKDSKWISETRKAIKEAPEILYSTPKRDRITRRKEAAVKSIAKKGEAEAAPKTVGKAPSKRSFSKIAADMSDDELSELSIDQVEQLSGALKGKAMSLRSKKARADRAAKNATSDPEQPKAIVKKAPVKKAGARPKAKQVA